MKQVKITTSMLKKLIREELEEQHKNKKKIQEAMSSAAEKLEPETETSVDTSSIPRENIRSFFSQFDDPDEAALTWVEIHGKPQGNIPPRYDFMFWAANDPETPQELKDLLASHPNPLISAAAKQ